jgi:hypothetical protein
MKITSQHKVNFTVQFEVNESELRALGALAGYGDDMFIQAFYEKLGRDYMEAHEWGMRTFLTTLRKEAPALLGRLDTAREMLEGKVKA